MSLTAELAKATAYEVDLAVTHLAHTRPQDLRIMDRNYPSYRMIAEFQPHKTAFVIRCPAASFGIARQMFKGEGDDSQTVTLTPCAKQMPLIQQLGLSQSLIVRFVRVQLDTGEWKVLVTSLQDESCYPTAEQLHQI